MFYVLIKIRNARHSRRLYSMRSIQCHGLDSRQHSELYCSTDLRCYCTSWFWSLNCIVLKSTECSSTLSKLCLPSFWSSLYNCYCATCISLLHRVTANGAYDIQLPPHSTRARVYCHMQEVPGCGGGGWTLVMKINGSKVYDKYGK